MKTYEKLLAGELCGATKLVLSCGLETFPPQILDLADSLEILDLSNNRLSALPEDFGRLKKLRILFVSNNHFREFPSVLSQCPDLTMVGFKSNTIMTFPEDALPPKIRWLILTDNRITKLPDSIGSLKELQKLMLAGNQIVTLPDTMRACTNLELIRLSANQLERLPAWIFALPKLAWLACAGNPGFPTSPIELDALDQIGWEDLLVQEMLGEGASGIISRATLRDGISVAIKLFKGEVTSDGYPADEIAASIAAGKHHNLNTPHGKVVQHPQERKALVFPLIPPHYGNLGNPPSLESCTRDTYDEERFFILPQILRIARDIASAALHLHEKGINHGDLYAHNILIDQSSHCLLGDFGAATQYDRSLYGTSFERLEVRAWGCLFEDLLDRSLLADEMERGKLVKLEQLKAESLQSSIENRPLFSQILGRLDDI